MIRYDYEDKVIDPQTNNNLGSRLEAIGHDINNDSTNDLTYAYTYDAVGNCQTKVIDASETRSYLYDNIYQLTEDNKTSGDKFNWAYDALSNWDYVNLNGSLHKQFDIASGNRLNQYTSVNSVSFAYDGNGNLISDGTYTYEYDPENRLLAVKLSGATVVSYGYDALGRRVSKTVGAATTHYCYDGDQVIAEYDGSGTLLRKFIYGPGIDEPICMTVPGSPAVTYFYHQDALGSVAALSKFNTSLGCAEVVERYQYSAFGQTQILSANNELRTTSLFGNPYMFTGREYESETGLYYYRARFYNPAIGRFLQTDPVGYYDSMNLYQYCGNNPLMFIDPFGLCANEYTNLTTGDIVVRTLAEIAYNTVNALYYGIHGGLDVAGVYDPTPACDFLNAAGYAGEGDWKNVGYSAVSIAPYAGDVIGKGGKYGPKVAAVLKKIPHSEGVYEFIAASGKKYIGQSKDLYRRIMTHLRKGKLDPGDIGSIKTKEMPGSSTIERKIVEQGKIDKGGGPQPMGPLENQRNSIKKSN